ncbi:transcription factor [Pseudogymnoascus australis]
MSANDAFHMLDHELPSFNYPGAYIDYQFPEFLNASYLLGAQFSYPTEGSRVDVGPQSSSSASNALGFTQLDDLPTSPSTRPALDLLPGTMELPFRLHGTALSIPGFKSVESRTVMNQGRVTLGDSPEETPRSPPKWAKPTLLRKQSRKGKSFAVAPVASSNSSATSDENLSGTQVDETKFKKQRKPRRSSKKPTTAEQAAVKREKVLKRNREAACKCRVKTKAQKAEVVGRVKALGEDNAAKRVEVETFQRELEGLRVLLLPHYTGCEDEQVVAYLDGLCGSEPSM